MVGRLAQSCKNIGLSCRLSTAFFIITFLIFTFPKSLSKFACTE